MSTSKSPWNAYGRIPPATARPEAPPRDVTLGAIDNVLRGRQQLEKYLDRTIREYFEIRSGAGGYRHIIEAALHPSSGPETVEERLARLAREASARRSGRSPRPPSA